MSTSLPSDICIMTSDLERFIACCEVIESGENFADHLPITCVLNIVRAAVSEPQDVEHKIIVSAPTRLGGIRKICYYIINCLVYICKLLMYRLITLNVRLAVAV